MNICVHKFDNFGKGKKIRVPGSKSHTIRALILACISEGETKIFNPLKSQDALSTAKAIKKIGAEIEFHDDQNYWLVKGAGKNFHIPETEIDVENSGSLMYFLTPVLATKKGRVEITGDSSICKRPVGHLIDALYQMGADAFCKNKDSETPPFEFTGPINNENILFTEGKLSQYISGFMMAATQMNGLTQIQLTAPQETPYLSMTEYWLKKYGVNCAISPDYKSIAVSGPVELKAQDVTIPSDWEAVAFPLIAGLIANEHIIITDIDSSGTQGDEKIVSLLKDYGADIVWDKEKQTLEINSFLKENPAGTKYRKLSVKENSKIISMAEYPDAICALSVIACFAEGKTIFTDIDICRKKETDRIKVMKDLLSSLGADIKDNGNTLEINGHSPYKNDSTENINPEFMLHGGKVNSFLDHRVAMSLSCYGLFLPKEDSLTVLDAECASVSFPDFYSVMNKNLGTEFISEN